MISRPSIPALLDSPAFTGTPTAPTPDTSDSSTRIATTALVAAKIAALVASSPAALDTLNELAAAIGNDANFAATMVAALAGKAASTHTHAQSDVTGLVASLAGKLDAISYTAADVLAKLLTVDGTGSTLDADLYRGLAPSAMSMMGVAPPNNSYLITPGHSAVANSAVPQSWLVYNAQWIPPGWSPNRLACEVTTGNAGQTLRMGLYSASTTTGLPDQLLHDSGDISAVSTGIKETTIAALPSSGVWVWACLCVSGAAVVQFRCVSPGANYWAQTVAASPVGSGGPSVRNGGHGSGALPATAVLSPSGSANHAALNLRRV